MEGSKEEEEGMDVAAYDWLEVVVKGNGRGLFFFFFCLFITRVRPC